MGIRFHWVDNFVAAKHRGGGISHGNTLNLSESYRKYRYDEIVFFKKDVLPYKNMMSREDRCLMQNKWDWVQWAYFKTFLNFPQKVGVLLQNLPAVAKIVFRYIKRKFVYCVENNYLLKKLAVRGIICLALSLLFALKPFTPWLPEEDMVVHAKLFLLFSAPFFLLVLFLLCLRLCWRLWKRVKPYTLKM